MHRHQAWAGLPPAACPRVPPPPRAAQGTCASGCVAVTGQPGALLPAGTILVAPSRVRFCTEIPTYISAIGITIVPVIAAQPGEAGNLAPGTGLCLQSPLQGVDAAAVSGLILGGAGCGQPQDRGYPGRCA